MRILVTGGAGFIGLHLCKRLLEKGHRLVVIDNLITSDISNINHFKNNPNVTFIHHDISKPFSKSLQTHLFGKRSKHHKVGRINLIFHLACPTGVPNLTKYSEEMLKTCTIGTFNVLEFAKENGARVVFTSSSEVYGNPTVKMQKESYTGNVSPVGERSPYEEGKRVSESICMMYVRKYKVDIRIARVFNTYGPGFAKNEYRVIPQFISSSIKNEPITVYGTGSQTRTFCYIDDLVDGLLTIMESGKKGEVYNIGDDHEISIKKVAKLVIQKTNSKSKIIYKKHFIEDHRSRHPDLTKIKKLGWSPKVNLPEGLEKTAAFAKGLP